MCTFFFFKKRTAYDMRMSDLSSDVCSSDLSVGTVAHRMFFVRLDLAERLITADRLKDRIIAEALRPARRPDDQSVYAAFKAFDMADGPGQRQRADEMVVMPGVRPRPFHRFIHQPHGHAAALVTTEHPR